MLMIDYTRIGWWYWMATACVLSAGVAGHPQAFVLAIGLTVFQLLHFALREGRITAFPVQVRFCYLLFLLMALPETMQWLYWVSTVGTWAQVLFGYCTLARSLSLLPWNRRQQLSSGLIRETFLARPVRGNIMQGLPPLA